MTDPTTPAPKPSRAAWKVPAAIIAVLAVFVGVLFATGVIGDGGNNNDGAVGGRAGGGAG